MQEVPDSHDLRLRREVDAQIVVPETDLAPEVRVAANLLRSLATRIGAHGSVLPGAIRRQRWSPFNGTLMWAAAGQVETCPMSASGCPHFLRGRVCHCFTVTLGERSKAKLEGDTVGEERAHPIDDSAPTQGCRQRRETRAVGTREQWVELMEGVRQSSSSKFLGNQTEGDDELIRRALRATA